MQLLCPAANAPFCGVSGQNTKNMDLRMAGPQMGLRVAFPLLQALYIDWEKFRYSNCSSADALQFSGCTAVPGTVPLCILSTGVNPAFHVYRGNNTKLNLRLIYLH